MLSQFLSVADFTFEGGNKTFIRLSNNGAAYWGKKTKGGLGLANHHLKQL